MCLICLAICVCVYIYICISYIAQTPCWEYVLSLGFGETRDRAGPEGTWVLETITGRPVDKERGIC